MTEVDFATLVRRIRRARRQTQEDTATGSPEHLRRLFYNAITRAISHCTVMVLGWGRLNGPPFAAL
jgi:hypothetical protein